MRRRCPLSVRICLSPDRARRVEGSDPARDCSLCSPSGLLLRDASAARRRVNDNSAKVAWAMGDVDRRPLPKRCRGGRRLTTSSTAESKLSANAAGQTYCHHQRRQVDRSGTTRAHQQIPRCMSRPAARSAAPWPLRRPPRRGPLLAFNGVVTTSDGGHGPTPEPSRRTAQPVVTIGGRGGKNLRWR